MPKDKGKHISPAIRIFVLGGFIVQSDISDKLDTFYLKKFFIFLQCAIFVNWIVNAIFSNAIFSNGDFSKKFISNYLSGLSEMSGILVLGMTQNCHGPISNLSPSTAPGM